MPAGMPGWRRRWPRHGAALAANRRVTLDRLRAAQDGTGDAFPAADLAITGPEGEEAPEDEVALRLALEQGRPRDLAAGRTLVGPHAR